MLKEKENKKSKSRVVVLVFTIFSIIASIFCIYEIFLLSSIENLARFIVIAILIFIDLFIILKTRMIFKAKNKKKTKRIGYILFLLSYSIICAVVGIVIFYVYNILLGNINKVYITYSSSLVTMSNNEINDIIEVQDYTIGRLYDKKSPDGYIIPQEIIKEYKLEDENVIEDYDNYSSMLADLYSGEIDAIFLPSAYDSMFSSITDYENISLDTKIIISKDKKMKKSEASDTETESSGKSITEPFTILLMGIDSTDEVLSKNAIANGDTLILITFNPKTLSATMFSIPRDSYVPIACWANKAENKITHAAGYGTDCMINTIENYFDVNIDYYAKLNFKGLVKLVNAVGGLEVDVKQKLCTDDSSRGQEICIKPGLQTLNGEQALVYARNRKSLANGDFGRAQHQQEIVKLLINKVKDIRDVSKFIEILNTVSNSLDTNFTRKQMLSFYNIAKDVAKRSLSSDSADLIEIQQLYLQGDGQMIYDENIRMTLWNYVPNKDSKKDIIKAMKENLELIEHEEIKEFSFSVNTPYEKKVIGEGPYKTSYTYDLLPNFIGYTESTARSIASKYGVKVSFTGGDGTVIAQSYPVNKRIDKIKGSIQLTLSKKDNTSDKVSAITKDKDKNKDKDKEKDNKEELNKNSDNKNQSNNDNNNVDDDGSDSSENNRDTAIKEKIEEDE